METISIKVPQIGDTDHFVKIVRWMKKNGDQVRPDDVIAEAENDKALFELTAYHQGTIEIVVQEGEKVPVGTEIARIKQE